MEARHKILIADDDPAVLEMLEALLQSLTSKPEVHTTTSGAKALAMLNDEAYRLFICDLHMPRMDGLQVLSIVRRTHPNVRTVAITGLEDEQFRSRVYALGIDLFWHKPTSEHETRMFQECLESLLGQDTELGFRGLQSKSLVDIIQMECMTGSSAVLRISNGPLSGKICILEGDVVDAETGELRGEEAFSRVLSWRAGSFETLQAEPSRPRTIFKPWSNLLLESAQVVDEARGNTDHALAGPGNLLSKASRVEGVEFMVIRKPGGTDVESRGVENPQEVGGWATNLLNGSQALADQLQLGPIQHIEAVGLPHRVSVCVTSGIEFCIGWDSQLSLAEVRERSRKVFALWVS